MDITTQLQKYRELKSYFDPEYERENEVLSDFKNSFPALSDRHTVELKEILESGQSINNKYFVADLLYLYNPFSKDLFEPMIDCAISHEDPSFNRIFLIPCINSFGIPAVKDLLGKKSESKIPEIQNGIQRLQYWLRISEQDCS